MQRADTIDRSVMVSALFLAIFLVSCGAGKDLPCPISHEQMDHPDPDWPSFTLQNEACISICSVNIAPGSCDDWGYDWLGSDSLPPGDQLTFHLPPGRYDLLLEDCTQYEYVMEKVDIDNDSYFEITGEEEESSACRHWLTVINHSSEPICYMWIAGPHSVSFGANWLGDDSIPAGDERKFIVPEGVYDLKAEGCEFELLNVELDVKISGETLWVVPSG